MSSFNGEDYHRIYIIGLSLWKHRSDFTKRLGCELMDMAEEVIGQQSGRPVQSRVSRSNGGDAAC